MAWGELGEDGELRVWEGASGHPTGEVLRDFELLAPAEPSKIVCVGRNYRDHIAEMNAGDLPREPGLFLKGPNTLLAPGKTLPYPAWTEEFHYEGELALVIGQRVRDLTPELALEAVRGYTCAVDLTARDAQRSDLQWLRAKSADGFCPLGPYLVAGLHPNDLRIVSKVNGELRQDGRTSQMIFDVTQVLVYITRFMTLEAGDVVLTGTPAGVGALTRGDTVEVEIEGIGTLSTHIG